MEAQRALILICLQKTKNQINRSKFLQNGTEQNHANG